MISAGLALARVEDIPDAGARLADAAGASLILTRRGDAVRAFRNRCTHADYPLQRADGRLIVQEGRYLVCAMHGASYRLDDGACAGGPCNGGALEPIAIIVRDGVIFTA
ncbi:MAG: Rieske 2Fe-2S domain-containing protein [Terricaulis sp.]|nr:Rieske 2Fe-2S domain-containing protein [Terricaulis sp.]